MQPWDTTLQSTVWKRLTFDETDGFLVKVQDHTEFAESEIELSHNREKRKRTEEVSNLLISH